MPEELPDPPSELPADEAPEPMPGGKTGTATVGAEVAGGATTPPLAPREPDEEPAAAGEPVPVAAVRAAGGVPPFKIELDAVPAPEPAGRAEAPKAPDAGPAATRGALDGGEAGDPTAGRAGAAAALPVTGAEGTVEPDG